MKKEQKPKININIAGVKTALKSKEVQKSLKDALKAIKGITDSIDVNK